jgi:hypothetical protein
MPLLGEATRHVMILAEGSKGVIVAYLYKYPTVCMVHILCTGSTGKIWYVTTTHPNPETPASDDLAVRTYYHH